MSANAAASSGASHRATASIRMRHRLAFAVALTVLLSGADVSGGGEDGPMASAPLPPPLPTAPPTTVSQQPRREPSSPSRHELPQSRPRAQSGMQVAHLPKRSADPHHLGHFAGAARGQKRLGQPAAGDVERRETSTVPQVASSMIPPPTPSPFPYGYIPGALPTYGYAPVYPPPWLPGPTLPR